MIVDWGMKKKKKNKIYLIYYLSNKKKKKKKKKKKTGLLDSISIDLSVKSSVDFILSTYYLGIC